MIDIHVPVFDFFIYFLILAIVFFLFGYGNSLINNNTKGFTKEQVDKLEEALQKIPEYPYEEDPQLRRSRIMSEKANSECSPIGCPQEPVLSDNPGVVHCLRPSADYDGRYIVSKYADTIENKTPAP